MNVQLKDVAASEFSLWINGKAVAGASTFPVINPATEEVLTDCPRADLAQLNQAVAAAKAAFPAWCARPIEERRQMLRRLADTLEAQSDRFAVLLTREQGKPVAHAAFEIAGAVDMIRTFATMDLPVDVLKETATTRIVRLRVPLGVVAAITPWNFPLILLMIKLAPALLSGNTVVCKPAPTTPLTTLRIGELCAEIFPAGVINVITDQNDLGTALTTHPDVAKVAFTGSTTTGKKVMASAASAIKRLTLELGGNDAAIVLDDIDVKEVAPKIFMGAMLNTGQVCLAIKRVYAHDSIYESLCAELARLADTAIVGDGMDPRTQFGPMQNKVQFEKVKGYIEDARAHGRIIAGGKVGRERGYFVSPTIVRDISDDARLVREEQFGPVLPVLRYSDVNDAVGRANSTEYGLGATVWSSDPARAYEVALKLNSGTIWINKHLELPADVPFSGAKQSGLGTEMGREGLLAFTQAKVIHADK